MSCVSQGFPTAWFHVVSVQGSGLMELLLALLSGRDLIFKFFLKDTAQTIFSCGFVLLSGSVAWLPVSFLLHFNRRENSAFCSVRCYPEIEFSITSRLLKLHLQLGLPSCCSRKEAKKKKGQLSLTLVSENPRAVAKSWHRVGRGQAGPLHCLFLRQRHYMPIFNIQSHSYYLIALTVRLIKNYAA